MTAVIGGYEKRKRSRVHAVSPTVSILTLQSLGLAAHGSGRPVAPLVLLFRRLRTTDIRRHKESLVELDVNLEERCEKRFMLFSAG